MDTGMLWFDDTQDDLQKKITKALDYYQKKYGKIPNLVLVHPSMLKEAKLDDSGITVRPYRPVLPGHIWIGIEDTK